MHVIRSATLRPGATVTAIVEGHSAETKSTQKRLIRGKALIFWDPTLAGTKYGRKRDAIDTDQITPAADCVSETLETLDERWKAGAFRYLMPDFRARVHRGETFVIAGDRFAIGSSREMSPAGLKAVAEEAGLEMVIICGDNMGDIFRRNALNLGLHVVQSPEAVADARDGDEFSFDPDSRQIANITQGKVYEPKPLTPKEDELRRSGGIVAAGRREFRASIEHEPRIEFPDASIARELTTTEQIIWAHRVDKDQRSLKPGDTLRVYADLLPASDGTAPFAIHTFNQITRG
jgi:3-isopropylmalate/(R)-2-methylmalate dehydratase small subunit